MKTLCLFILTFVMLYNPKVQAASDEIELTTVENGEARLASIQLLTKDPLGDIDKNLASYMELVDIFKEFQTYNVNLSNHLLEKIQNNNTFSGDDLYLIKRTFDMFFQLNSKMIEFSNLYEFKAVKMAQSFAQPTAKLALIKAHLIWLSSNVLVMEQLQDVHTIIFRADGAFRRIVKSSAEINKLSKEDRKNLKELTDQVDYVTTTIQSAKFIQQITLVRSIQSDLRGVLEHELPSLSLLEEVINNKISTQLSKGRRDFKLKGFVFTDTVIGIFNSVTNFLSGFFGNIAGSIAWRKGNMFESTEALNIAKKNLQPMDIILEKSPFVLTDKFIPGHFGHAAIYLGTKEQLQKINMWNHPDIIPYHASILAGNTILEAVRSGVRLNSIEGFLNIDEMTMVRKLDGLQSEDQVFEQITRGIDQLGKEYDFNFDISTLDKIVCSELIYIVFGNVTWPTHYRVGRPTITPDDIAEVLFQKNTRFKVTESILSTKRQKIEKAPDNRLADILDYELRTEDGEVVTDPSDPKNSFWKKETKCYTLTDNAIANNDRRTCKTVYKEYYYEEVAN